MKSTQKRGQRLPLSLTIFVAVFAMCAGCLATARPARATVTATAIYNNSSVGLGIVTNLGSSYAYVLLPYRWSPTNARGGYTGSGWCTNVYYNMGDGVWQYRFQVRGASYWSVAYVWVENVRADSWRC